MEICGGIASGKTTLAQLLQGHGVSTELEQFEQNPFWALFYENPCRYGFETETTFLLQHYSQMRDGHARHDVFVYDTSFVQDLAYARANLDRSMLTAFLAVYEYTSRALPRPALLIHLVCDPVIELARIRERRRPQEAAIKIDYLVHLNEQVRMAVSEVKSNVHVIEIDSGTNDFATDPTTSARIARMLIQELVTIDASAAT
jgi:deoxyadenosine/deoxycytidine kinase